ncbi:MAG: 3-methyl-2-oxobutanoate dehydrogenase subunit VorB [Deltaproteobacteria bacterium]|nr:MAG: 3-methyl-2-oxobutanoate dehydrogenase subunit VorB [Deltaproteobacteria bacterium]
MLKKVFIKGNEAIARAAVDAGCRYYFGYPITPQSDIPEYLSKVLPKLGGEFIQAESEIASINMLMGASAAGARSMTSSSGPGISLKQEGLSYMAGSELPGVVVNVARCGPGLGGIAPSQAEYFQATKGGGHGDYRLIVLAPESGQEMYDLTFKAFDLADKYRNPAMILADGMLGQMKEPVLLQPPRKMDLPDKDWVLSGAKGRPQNIIKSLYLGDKELERHTWQLWEKYQRMKKEDVMFEAREIKDARLIIAAFGSCARIAKSTLRQARAEGLKVGLIRPITLFPFPEEIFRQASIDTKMFLTIEMNTGQMVEDVRLSVSPGTVVYFYGRPPGAGSLPSPDEILREIKKVYEPSSE